MYIETWEIWISMGIVIFAMMLGPIIELISVIVEGRELRKSKHEK